MWWFILGIVVGFVLTAMGMTSLIVGKLRTGYDQTGVYLFAELDKSPDTILETRKYVVLRVVKDPWFSQE